MLRSLFSRWRLGLVGALLFLLAYVGAWDATRGFLLQRTAGPALDAVTTPRAATFDASIHPATHTIRLRRLAPPDRQASDRQASDAAPPSADAASALTSLTVHPPGGVRLLLSGLLLVFFAPHRPYWLYLLGLHVALGAACVGALCVGIGWTDWGFDAAQFVSVYLVDAASLLLVVGGLLRETALPPDAPPPAAASTDAASTDASSADAPTSRAST